MGKNIFIILLLGAVAIALYFLWKKQQQVSKATADADYQKGLATDNLALADLAMGKISDKEVQSYLDAGY